MKGLIGSGARFAGCFAVLSVLAGAPEAEARDCEARYPPPATVAAMFDMALALDDALAERGNVRVALLARGGQDLTRYGLRHSHLGFAIRRDGQPWRVVHLLNRCKSGESDLYIEGLGNFAGESATRADVRVAVLAPALQERLMVLLDDNDGRARALHEPSYSMVAYPFSTEYQNSNQWILEVLALALVEHEMQRDGRAGVRPHGASRERMQAWLKTAGFRPSRLHLKLSERVGARFGIAHVAVTDHPARERIGGDYSVTTVESVFDFLAARKVITEDFAVTINGKGRSP